MTEDILLQTVKLKKYFSLTGKRKLHAVDDVSVHIERGKTLGVVGESGCGKTTLGKTVLRLHEPTSGKIIFNGQDITPLRKSEMRNVRNKMQIIFQDPYSSLNPRMTIEESIAEPMIVNRFYSKPSDVFTRVDKLMDIVGLAERYTTCFPHELSGGLRQRVGIARAISLNPEFIICDEPVSSLDVSVQAQILNLLMDLQAGLGLTYMFITHNLSVVKHISHQISVMYLGQCVEMAGTDDIFEQPLHPYTRTLLAAIPEPSLETRKKEDVLIKGEVLSPIDPEPGCRFCPRCEYAEEVCLQPQVFREVLPNHYVSCCKAEQFLNLVKF